MFSNNDEQVSASHLQCIQRVRGLWRIYPDNEDDENALITNGLAIRNMLIQFYTKNPKAAAREQSDHYRIRVSNIPCSADDGQIYISDSLLALLVCCSHSDLHDIRYLYDLACCTVYMSTDLDTHIVYGLAVGIYCI
jgi:hypothetical protein